MNTSPIMNKGRRDEPKTSQIAISVIIPVYKSGDCLGELAGKLIPVLEKITEAFEIILVNDYSTDHSWEKILELCKLDMRIKGIHLRKTFGQDSAIMAGLNYSCGRSVIIMDDDCQHDPTDIPGLLGKLEKGYDVCYACFNSKKQSWFKNFGSWFNDKVANIILKKPKEVYLSPYKAISQEVVNEIIKYNGPYPYIDGLLFRITQNITQVPVEHHERFAGRGNYNLRKSVGVWLRLATNFSIFPLRIATFLGFISSGIGFLLSLFFILQHFMKVEAPSGWASLILTVLFLGGIQLISIGIIGEYIGRLFLHHSKEPQFIIKKMVGITHEEN